MYCKDTKFPITTDYYNAKSKYLMIQGLYHKFMVDLLK